MKHFIRFFILLIAIGLVFSSCRKTNNEPNNDPTNFLDLKVSQAFNFESFADVQTAIQLVNSKASGKEIVQIYDAHPSQGGKLILTGAADENGMFTLPIRIATRFEEVYIAKLSSVGLNEYVPVPVEGNKIQFNFAKASGTKTLSEWCDCETPLPNNFNGNLVIDNNETVCISEGNHATMKKLEIKSGGVLKICGTAVVEKYQSDSENGTIIVSPSGSLTLPKYTLRYTVENYGTTNVTGSGSGQIDATVTNWGTMGFTIKQILHGTLTNNGTLTSTKDFEINSDGDFTNNCEFLITNGGEFKQSGAFINNGYLSVSDEAEFTGSGNKKTILGTGSLIDTEKFKINGEISGPSGGQAQITAEDNGDVNAGAVLSNLDLCADDPDYNPNATYNNVTYCDISLPAPQCDANVPPDITSSLQIGGIAGQAITPYVITATGTEPITFNASNLPAGLSFNSATHTIGGTPAAAGTYNITISASNVMGEDVETLVLIVTQPTAPPVITSPLTASATVDEPFSYTLTASGTGPITYDATNLPAGLSFDAGTQQITGNPTAAGTYNITLTATNAGGTATETLVLTVGTPPTITSPLTASGTAGVQFSTYTVDGTGTPEITYSASNLPQGLTFNSENNTINGTPLFPGEYNVLLTATNAYGNDAQTLVITINEGLQPPTITSVLTANGMTDFPFSYVITADGSQPMTFNASNLPAGLTFDGNTISGIPTVPGTYNIGLSAINAAGTDSKVLVLVIQTGGGTDTDGDGVPDNLDAYPTDPTRAFNSYYPNEVDFVSAAFEDLWPAYGDYDFNDFVVNLNYKMVTNAQNEMVDVILKYQIMADGASLENGFGIVFDALPATVESVTGCIKLGNAVVIDPKGYEAGHTNQTVIIPIDNINTIMEGGMANTIPNGKYVQTSVTTVTTHFSTPQASIGTPPFNPFIFVDQERGHEVHLKNQPPTEFVDTDYFGTDSDASDPGAGIYYMSATGLPWGIETPVNFNYPIEKADILTAHLKFAAWAQSSGIDFPDWYLDKPGYRNDANIYVIP